MALAYASSRRWELAAGMASGAAITSAIPKHNKSLRGSRDDEAPEPPLTEMSATPIREDRASGEQNTTLANITKTAAIELASGKSWQEVAIALGDAVALQVGVMAAAKAAGAIQNHCTRRYRPPQTTTHKPPPIFTSEVERQTPIHVPQTTDRFNVEMTTYDTSPNITANGETKEFEFEAMTPIQPMPIFSEETMPLENDNEEHSLDIPTPHELTLEQERKKADRVLALLQEECMQRHKQWETLKERMEDLESNAKRYYNDAQTILTRVSENTREASLPSREGKASVSPTLVVPEKIEGAIPTREGLASVNSLTLSPVPKASPTREGTALAVVSDTRVQKDLHVEPSLPQPMPSGIYKWQTSSVDLWDLNIYQRNDMTTMIKTYVAVKSGVAESAVWIGLSQGSLVVQGEVMGNPDGVQWPTEEDMMAILVDVLRRNTRLHHRAPQVAPGDIIQNPPGIPINSATTATTCPEGGAQAEPGLQYSTHPAGSAPVDTPTCPAGGGPTAGQTMAERVQTTLRPSPLGGPPTREGMASPAQAVDPWAQARLTIEPPAEQPNRFQDHFQGFRLVTEKTLNLTKLHGEQDSKNRISYMKWSRMLKDFIETKGRDGQVLVETMEWAESMDRLIPITDDMIRQRFPQFDLANNVKQLMLLIKNWTDGIAEQVIMYNVKNGRDAWRKLHHHQLPEIEHRKQMLMNEFNTLSKANTLNDMKDRIMEIERITSTWTGIADQTFDEEIKLSKLRTIVPTNIYNFIVVGHKMQTIRRTCPAGGGTGHGPHHGVYAWRTCTWAECIQQPRIYVP